MVSLSRTGVEVWLEPLMSDVEQGVHLLQGPWSMYLDPALKW